MLMIGETYNEHKLWLMDGIGSARQIIRSFRESQKRFPELDFTSAIVAEQRIIAENLKDLRDLERYRKKIGIDKDEPYRPKPSDNPAPMLVDISALWKDDDGK